MDGSRVYKLAGARAASEDLALEALHLAFRVQGDLAARIAVPAREHSLSSSEAVALLWLRRSGASPISGIARAAAIRPNGASVLVDRLRARRLVRRERSPRDSRVVSVELTAAGADLAASLAPLVAAELRGPLDALSAGERQQLLVLLARLSPQA